MAINEADEHCSAILHVWYPGQMGGLAAARLLMGEAGAFGQTAGHVLPDNGGTAGIHRPQHEGQDIPLHGT